MAWSWPPGPRPQYILCSPRRSGIYQYSWEQRCRAGHRGREWKAWSITLRLRAQGGKHSNCPCAAGSCCVKPHTESLRKEPGQPKITVFQSSAESPSPPQPLFVFISLLGLKQSHYGTDQWTIGEVNLVCGFYFFIFYLCVVLCKDKRNLPIMDKYKKSDTLAKWKEAFISEAMNLQLVYNILL